MSTTITQFLFDPVIALLWPLGLRNIVTYPTTASCSRAFPQPVERMPHWCQLELLTVGITRCQDVSKTSHNGTFRLNFAPSTLFATTELSHATVFTWRIQGSPPPPNQDVRKIVTTVASLSLLRLPSCQCMRYSSRRDEGHCRGAAAASKCFLAYAAVKSLTMGFNSAIFTVYKPNIVSSYSTLAHRGLAGVSCVLKG